jgi:cysteinyl-tRNA synthetase
VLSEPDPERVNDILTNILEDVPSGGAFTGRELAALALADSEARLDAAHAHYVACQPEGVDPDMRKLSDMLEDFLYMEDILDETKREAIRRIFRVERFETRARASRQRLALRYMKEARARRDRALAAFLSHCDMAKRDVL